MKLAIGSDIKGKDLNQQVVRYLADLGYDVENVTQEDTPLMEATTTVIHAVQEGKADRGIIIDEYGIAPFIIANKYTDIICANAFDEHSAFMTRGHNNANIITIGSGIVGPRLAEKIAETFAEAEYDGGRHQIRVDMLNKMC